MLDRDTGRITEEERVSRLANKLVEPVDLLLCADDQLVERLTKLSELKRREDARRLAALGVRRACSRISARRWIPPRYRWRKYPLALP
jgi:hypothetical protein